MTTRPAAPILLVDDEPANLLALEAVLHALGEPLVRADSGQAALRKLRDNDFAAVLLDVHMPGMDGFETARLIRAQRRSRGTPILFITADNSDLRAEEAYSLGAIDFLTKPLLPVVLEAKLQFFVELHRSKRELEIAERQAVEDRAFLSAVLEAVEDGIIACDAQGELTLFNRATRDFHGLPLHPLRDEQGRARLDLHLPDMTPLAREQLPLMRALAGEQVRDTELVIASPRAPRRTVIVNGQPLYDESGAKLGAVISMHDVSSRYEVQAAREAAATEQVRREEAEAASAVIRESQSRLIASQERVRLATDAARLGIWVWEEDGDRLGWENERLFTIFGVLAGEAATTACGFIEEFVHPGDAESLEQAMAFTAHIGTRLHFEGRFHRRSDGSLRWIELTGVLQAGEDGAPRRILGTAADITERKQAEEELRRSEERYRTLFESIDEGFCVIDLLYDAQGAPVDYRFLEMNPAFSKQTGLQRALGKRIRELVPDHEEHWFTIYDEVARTGTSARFDSYSQGLGRWFDVYATRLGADDSRKVAVLFDDITERRRSEESLRVLAQELAETDRRKTEFLATLAHELRNPLAPIVNGLHLLRMAEGSPEAQQKARDMMERQLRHMVHLVDDLLDIARISSNKVDLRIERVDLHAVLASAVETSTPLIAGAGHRLEVELPAGPLVVDGDMTRLAQVVSNLLNNAAKYTPHGGRITLRALAEVGHAVVQVSDSGIGIPQDALQDVFEMFTQVGRNRDRSQGGLGIGLALVTRLVQLHGGSVDAQSAGRDGGSTFTVRLPLATSTVIAPAQPADDDTHRSGGQPLRVLVVDDNVDAADSLASLLDLQGHETRVAHDADTALETAGDFHPDVVFLDIGMPVKDGYYVAKALRANPDTKGTVLVALTGWGAEEDRKRTQRAGFDHHLTKPAALDSVEALLRQIVVAKATA